ncbi:hypothetical protein ACI50E_06470 [Brucella sp. ZJ1_1]|uniref:hypothetical protein n=1 Tax=Brucella TaxID=234 RepID=UPI000586D64B|nr:hypothetical protein [Brucella intermedia]MCB4918047.1 hypothetical protein [Brucella intermedia]OOC52174.1 hypothetical protein AS855_11280 [Brucella intermedia M86]SUB12619.1 Uncharacterised protein [Brucella intermedia]
MSAGAASDRWKEERAKTQELLGKILMLWGDIMGLVYRLPEALGFSNPEAIQLGLAQINGDASRVAYLSKLLKHEPKLADVDAQRSADALAALSKLKKMNDRRDGFVHGVPVLTMKRHRDTREIIRDGCYLIQTRELDEKNRYLKVPEAAETFIAELEAIHEQLLRVTSPLLFEDWERILGTQP